MKRLPWADVILLVIISSARLISHSHLRCDWSTHLVVIVRAQWASAGIFPVLAWLVGCGCWRHGAASWSEWEAGLKRGVGPERETGEGAPRSSERHGVGPAKRILRLDRFFFLSTVSYLEVLKNNRSAWDTQSDSVVRVNLQRLCVSSKPLELSEKKKNWLRVKVWLRVSVRLLHWTNVTKTDCFYSRVRTLISTNGFKDCVQSFSWRNILHNKSIAISTCAPFWLKPIACSLD